MAALKAMAVLPGQIFKGPKTVIKLCLATFLVCWAEGKNTNDLYQLWMQQVPSV
jgi:hypothetical protein